MRKQGLEPGNYFPNVAMTKEVADLPLVEAIALVQERGDAMYQAGFRAATSFARDIERGLKSEVDALMGKLYFIGQKLGIDTPITKTVYWVAKAIDEYAVKEVI